MKKYILLVTIVFTVFSQKTYSQTANEIIGNLLNEENWHELKIQYPKLKGEIAPMLDYLSQAMLSVAFYDSEAGIVAIDSLLSNQEYQSQLGFGNVCNMVLLKSKLCNDKFQFRESSEVLSKFIEQAENYFTEDFRDAIQAHYEYSTALSKQKQVLIQKPNKDCNIKCVTLTKNNKSLLSFFCEVNGQNAQVIFDTGNPSFSLVSEKFAKKYGLEKVSENMPISGVGKGKAWLGVADSLVLGGIKCYNPLFYVVDSILPEKAIKEGAIEIEAVLGSNILFEIGEFQYFPKQNKITFPVIKTPLPQSGHNLVMRDDRHQYIQTVIDGNRKQMHFDTGSARTAISSSFYLANKDWILENGKKDSTNYAGFGGISSQIIYTLPNFKLDIGEKTFNLKDIEVQTEQSHDIWDGAGTIGFDFISKYDKIIVSYENMFIEIK